MNEDADASDSSQSPIPSGPVSHGGHVGHGGRSGHGWMMVLCCIPMVVAIIFIVFGR